MAARPRERARRDWPAGLREPRPGYFIWRNPDSGQELSIGRVSVSQAKREAYEALEFLQSKSPSLLERIKGSNNTVAQLIEKMPVSKTYNTAKTNRSLDKKIAAAIGAVPCMGLTVAHCSKVVEDEMDAGRSRSAQALRSRLFAICRRGQQLGWLESNPAEPTVKPEAKTMRQRLTLDQFKLILEKADMVADWLPGAMMLSLLTGMDRDTISQLERKAIGEHSLTILRGKTKVWIEIPLNIRMEAMNMTLLDALAVCRSNILSKHVIHHRKTYRKEVKAGAPVHPNNITRAFTEARNLAGIEGDHAPTFHEIRSLSKRTYVAQGNVDTKALLGHRDEKSAALYADPRGAEPIKVKVS